MDINELTYQIREAVFDCGLATDPHQTPLCELRTAGRLTQTFSRATPG
jgi:hypothetical protein